MTRMPRAWTGMLITAAILAAVGFWMSGRQGPALSRGAVHEVDDLVVLDVGAEPGVVVARTVVVRKGDTLGHIAQRELGSARAWRRIADVNPSVNPNRLVPGVVLHLPSSEDAATSATEGGHAFYLWRRDPTGPSGSLVPLSSGRQAELGADPAELIAIPLDSVRSAEAALREASAFGRPRPNHPGIVAGPRLEPVRAVPFGDPTSRVLHRVRVESVENETLRAAVVRERFDAKGRPIRPLPVEAAAGRPYFLSAALLLLVVGVMALARRLERRAAVEGFASP